MLGEAVDHLRHPVHADAVMVATGEQAGPDRRAERGGVEVRVAQSVGRQTVEGRRLDVGAVATEVRVAHVVQHAIITMFGRWHRGEGLEAQAMVDSAAVRLMVPVK